MCAGGPSHSRRKACLRQVPGMCMRMQAEDNGAVTKVAYLEKLVRTERGRISRRANECSPF